MEVGTMSSHKSAFVEFRRKVRNFEPLAFSVSQLPRKIPFTGRPGVVMHNRSVLNSRGEAGYFRCRVMYRLT